MPGPDFVSSLHWDVGTSVFILLSRCTIYWLLSRRLPDCLRALKQMLFLGLIPFLPSLHRKHQGSAHQNS